jgi:thiol-disulfide isomerase/thioredoxin
MKLRMLLPFALVAALSAAAPEASKSTEDTMLQDLGRALKGANGVVKADAMVTAWDHQKDTPVRTRLLGHFALGQVYDSTGDAAQAIRQYEAAEQVARQIKDSDAVDEISHELARLKETGQPLPVITGKALDGRTVDTAALRGNVVLVQFFASWCGPCRAEVPEVLALNRKYAAAGLRIVGVSLDNNTDDLQKYLGTQPLPWPILADFKGWESALAQQFGVDSIPESILVDQNGRIVKRGLQGDDLDQAIGKLLAK